MACRVRYEYMDSQGRKDELAITGSCEKSVVAKATRIIRQLGGSAPVRVKTITVVGGVRCQ